MKTLKLTTQERNSLYKKALERYLDGRSNFLCGALQGVMISIYGYVSLVDIPALFPEFEKFKPEKLELPSDLWWEDFDRESRIKCLSECIRLTEDDKARKHSGE